MRSVASSCSSRHPMTLEREVGVGWGRTEELETLKTNFVASLETAGLGVVDWILQTVLCDDGFAISPATVPVHVARETSRTGCSGARRKTPISSQRVQLIHRRRLGRAVEERSRDALDGFRTRQQCLFFIRCRRGSKPTTARQCSPSDTTTTTTLHHHHKRGVRHQRDCVEAPEGVVPEQQDDPCRVHHLGSIGVRVHRDASESART